MWKLTHHDNLHPPVSQFIGNNPTHLHTGTASLYEDVPVHAMKADTGRVHFILNLSARWEWSISPPWATLASWKKPCTHWIGGWLGPRAGMDGFDESLASAGIQTPDNPACSKLLYPLRHLGSHLYVIQYFLLFHWLGKEYWKVILLRYYIQNRYSFFIGHWLLNNSTFQPQWKYNCFSGYSFLTSLNIINQLVFLPDMY
jgi:hypothetical protein